MVACSSPDICIERIIAVCTAALASLGGGLLLGTALAAAIRVLLGSMVAITGLIGALVAAAVAAVRVTGALVAAAVAAVRVIGAPVVATADASVT
ncbi:MAG: hypothetical protein NVSMB42_08880 [Herpetosiphon sp.]